MCSVHMYVAHMASNRICAAENIIFKAEMIEMPSVPMGWTRVQMNTRSNIKAR